MQFKERWLRTSHDKKLVTLLIAAIRKSGGLLSIDLKSLEEVTEGEGLILEIVMEKGKEKLQARVTSKDTDRFIITESSNMVSQDLFLDETKRRLWESQKQTDHPGARSMVMTDEEAAYREEMSLAEIQAKARELRKRPLEVPLGPI